jgi:hypothetical protein
MVGAHHWFADTLDTGAALGATGDADVSGGDMQAAYADAAKRSIAGLDCLKLLAAELRRNSKHGSKRCLRPLANVVHSSPHRLLSRDGSDGLVTDQPLGPAAKRDPACRHARGTPITRYNVARY